MRPSARNRLGPKSDSCQLLDTIIHAYDQLCSPYFRWIGCDILHIYQCINLFSRGNQGPQSWAARDAIYPSPALRLWSNQSGEKCRLRPRPRRNPPDGHATPADAGFPSETGWRGPARKLPRHSGSDGTILDQYSPSGMQLDVKNDWCWPSENSSSRQPASAGRQAAATGRIRPRRRRDLAQAGCFQRSGQTCPATFVQFGRGSQLCAW